MNTRSPTTRQRAMGALRSAHAFLARRAAFLVGCLALLVVNVTAAMAPLDNGLSALRAKLIQRASSGEIAIVAIDTESLRAAGTWPWPRERYATVIDNLRSAGVRIVGFDVDFSARSTGEQDAALRAALANSAGAVVLPVFVQPDSARISQPIEAFSDDTLFGAVNIPVDRDGVVRRYSRGLDDGEEYYASLASVLAADFGASNAFRIDYGIRTADIDVLRFEDVYRNNFDPALVRGKAILIGATALELGDEFATPTRPTLSGVFIHALAFESLVQRRTLVAFSPLAVLFLAVVTMAFLWPPARPRPLPATVARHCAVLLLVIVGPFVLQRAAPIDSNLGLVLAAQALALWAHIRHELAYREAALAFEREARLTHVAHHDPETQLPNRRAMLEHLQSRLHGGTGEVAALIFGIDRFETLRGAIGYGRANEAVRRIASELERYTGESRVFQLSPSTLGQVLVSQDGWATGFEGLRVPVEVEGQEIDVVLRIGAAFSEDGAYAEVLLERASIALDRARFARRDSIVFHEDNNEDPAFQLALVTNVSRGLEDNQFRLVYQPKARADSLEVEGVEALMRWRHPVYGEIAPDRFITVAEDTGAIDELTRWALQRAIADSAALSNQGLDVKISINISGHSLSDAAFRDFAVSMVKQSNAKICFEITETAIISDPTAALHSIHAFRRNGISISIDDYGSGLSSLAYLREIAGDELKLDKSLIASITTNGRDRVILKSTIDLAHALDMKVVGEGVEDQLTRTALRALGCDMLQGYLISRPLLLPDLVAFLRSRLRESAHCQAPDQKEAI